MSDNEKHNGEEVEQTWLQIPVYVPQWIQDLGKLFQWAMETIMKNTSLHMFWKLNEKI
jgi:hypothetical protein